MRLLHVITKFGLGGAQEVATNLAIGLTERGHDLCVIAISKLKTVDDVGENQK